MWLPWRGRTTKRQSQTQPSSPMQASRSRSCGHSCTSFKDIQTILQSEPQPPSPKSPSLFRRLRVSNTLLRSFSSRPVPSSVTLPPHSDYCASVVIYYTSLTVVRRTYEDCIAVRSIFRGFAVALDERDVSVDERFREELQGILGRRNVSLPSVFVGGVYVGAAEDVRRMYDSGELREMVERLPKSERNSCDMCGGVKFIVCDECDGRHKVCTGKRGFTSCSSCDPNGLIRCPACFFVLPMHTK